MKGRRQHSGDNQPLTRLGGLRLGHLAGIEIYLDFSLLVIFALVVLTLGAGMFPAWHPDWSLLLRWSVAVIAAVSFFASILLHELAHAFVGRRRGVHVRRLTLFMFGGLAHFEDEFKRPRDEFLAAIAGPLLSFGLGVLLTVLGVALAPAAVRGSTEAVLSEQALASLSPGATILLWLGPINIVLALFNMVPGFPLDGGRVLRSALWAATGDRRRATAWAAALGQATGWLLITIGLLMVFGATVPFFGRGAVGGIWLMLIGWFLSVAARNSYRQLEIKSLLSDVPVARLMRTDVRRVPHDTTISLFVRQFILSSEQNSFPVEKDGKIIGIVGFRELNRVERSEWENLPVVAVMVPVERLDGIDPDDSADQALERMMSRQIEQVPVIKDGQVTGVLNMRDLFRWLSLSRNRAHNFGA